MYIFLLIVDLTLSLSLGQKESIMGIISFRTKEHCAAVCKAKEDFECAHEESKMWFCIPKDLAVSILF